MDERDLDKAEQALRRAVTINPKASAPLIALGESLRRKKRYSDAEKYLLDALKLDDKLWQAHFTLGRIYWETGDVKKAAQHIGQTLQLKPDFAEAHLFAGNILLRVNAPERALREYEEYLRLAPSGEFSAQAKEIVLKLRKALAEKRKTD
jgi:superkiller protein 3